MDVLHTISPRQLDARRRDGQPIRLLDVRSPDEFEASHADLAVNEPLDHLDPERVRRLTPPSEPIYVISRFATRGRQACERLRAAGCPNVVQVEGGEEGWELAGLPVVRHPRPTRRAAWMAAGLVLAAILLVSWLVHPFVGVLLAMLAAESVIADLSERHRAL